MKFFLLLLAVGLITVFTGLHGAEPDYAAWSAILKKYVRSGTKDGIKTNLVRYSALAQDPLWHTAQEKISGFDIQKLATRQEKLAFWINAYNIAAIRKVLERYPTQSIIAHGDGVWKERAITIAGNQYSLDAIEHKILRSMGDPRIHFAIVCASLSCPDLLREAYTGSQLERQLDEQTRSFISNTAKGVRIEADTVHLSAIFNWFAKDFVDLNKFLIRHGVKLPRNARMTEIPYNWKLNE